MQTASVPLQVRKGSEMDKSKRNREIDVLKGLTIIGVPLAHSGCPFADFFFLYTMSVFFGVSGYFFKDKYSNSIKAVLRFALKKIRRLWFPYFFWNTVFTLLNNEFIRLNIYTDNADIFNYVSGPYIGLHHYMDTVDILENIIKGIVFSGETQLGGALWFVRLLFTVSIVYCFTDWLLKKISAEHRLKMQLAVSAVLLAAGYYCSLTGWNYWGLGQSASMYWLYFSGNVLGENKDKIARLQNKHYIVIFIVSFSALLVLNKCGKVNLAFNYYVDPAYFLAVSFAGWGFLYSLSVFISETKLSGMMQYIGKNTLSVVILHFLAFKTVAYIVVKIYDLPPFCIAAFLNLYGERGLWWIAYTFVGIAVPIGLNAVYKKALSWASSFFAKKEC